MNPLLLQTRRHFFQDCSLGLGSLALASLLNDGRAKAETPALVNPLAPKRGHHAARAKHVIFLFMAGGPSQLELFDYKPKLTALHGKPIPDEFVKGKRFAFMDSFFAKNRPKLLAARASSLATAERGHGCRSVCRTPPASSMTSPWCARWPPTSSITPRRRFSSIPAHRRPAGRAWGRG